MARIIQLKTERLLLRQWKDEDLSPFAQINADPEVMKYFPNILTTEESNQFADRLRDIIQNRGWGLWALELKDTGEFIGYTGLHDIDDQLPFAPGIEIGWRLSKGFWGNGYATEAAKEVLRFALISLQLEKVYSFTSKINENSISVMEKIGMNNTDSDFNHPSLAYDHKPAKHVLFNVINEN